MTNRETLESAAAFYRAGSPEWTPCSREFADEMLGSVPPVEQRGWNFANGEPWIHNGAGEAVFLCVKYDGAAFHARYMTRLAFLAEVLNPKNS